jgi:RND family efflux transporter MFP subunit
MRTALLLALALASPALAETMVVTPAPVTEWKSVYATVEARRTVPARARIGGTIAALDLTEGQSVTAGAIIGRVEDEKLDFQLAAVDAQIAAAQAQLENAQAELTRGEALVERGVSTAQRLDALRTQVDVVRGQILSLDADRDRIARTRTEGDLLAPSDGLVVAVPVSEGEVVMPGEAVASIGTGGFFLRLQVPERYADDLREGDRIVIESAEAVQGRLAKVYPLIEGGRVQADVEVEGLDPRFVGGRIAVRLPVGERQALAVPQAALTHRGGLDFLQVMTDGAVRERVVLPGEVLTGSQPPLIEIVSGLAEGDEVLLP